MVSFGAWMSTVQDRATSTSRNTGGRGRGGGTATRAIPCLQRGLTAECCDARLAIFCNTVLYVVAVACDSGAHNMARSPSAYGKCDSPAHTRW